MPGSASPGFVFAIAAWLWLTVLFANFAEALAEGRGKAQAASLRSTRRDVSARKLSAPDRSLEFEKVPANSLRKGDYFLVHRWRHCPGRRRGARWRGLGGRKRDHG